MQENLYTTTTINRGFTPNGINNECVSNSSKESSQHVRLSMVRYCEGCKVL